MVSCVVTLCLVAALRLRVKFKSGDLEKILRDGPKDIHQYMIHNAGKSLMAVTKALPIKDTSRLCQDHKRCVWISDAPSAVNGMEIWAQEWRGSIFL